MSNVVAQNSTSSGLPPAPLQLQNRYLARYLSASVTRPLLTKSLTLAASYYIQALVSTILAEGIDLQGFLKLDTSAKVERIKKGLGVLRRQGLSKPALSMAAYGALISGPMKHYLPTLISSVSSRFIPKSFMATPRGALLTTLAVGLGIQAPIETTIYLLSMAKIGGAQTSAHYKAVLKNSFGFVYKATLVLQPLSMFICLKFIHPSLWQLFGSGVQFLVGLLAMTAVKQKRIAAARAAAAKGKDKSQ